MTSGPRLAGLLWLSHPTKRGRIDGSRLVLETLGVAGSDQGEVLRKLDLSDHAWTAQVQGAETHYHRVIGAAEQILAYAEEMGYQPPPMTR